MDVINTIAAECYRRICNRCSDDSVYDAPVIKKGVGILMHSSITVYGRYRPSKPVGRFEASHSVVGWGYQIGVLEFYKHKMIVRSKKQHARDPHVVIPYPKPTFFEDMEDAVDSMIYVPDELVHDIARLCGYV